MIEIIKAGLLATVQDQGRQKTRHVGVIGAGAMDEVALCVANRLVGNDDDAAVIEFTVGLPIVVRFGTAGRIAMAGADCAATLDGVAVHAWWSVPVEAGQTLTLQPVSQAMRVYLAVTGGIATPELLGSRSTDLQARFGGHEGRALADGDRLPVGAIGDAAAARIGDAAQAPFGVTSPAWRQLAFAGELTPLPNQPGSSSQSMTRSEPVCVRVLPGPEYDMFDAAAREALWNTAWKITPNSNRMGYRLQGTAMSRTEAARNVDLLSHTVLPGTIQVPPNGQPIVLMGDAQTAGGYPKIGAVITADLWLLAQARLNTMVRFVECSREDALAARRALVRYLQQVDIAIRTRPRQRPLPVRAPSVAADATAGKPAAKSAASAQARGATANSTAGSIAGSTVSSTASAVQAPRAASAAAAVPPASASPHAGKQRTTAKAPAHADAILTLSDDDAVIALNAPLTGLLFETPSL